MHPNTKKKVEKMLERLWFVQWDRYVFDKDSNAYSLYGWMKRNDTYKDFIEIEFQVGNRYWDFTTSSANWHDTICDILSIPRDTSNHCIRIEDSFNIKNSIKL